MAEKMRAPQTVGSANAADLDAQTLARYRDMLFQLSASFTALPTKEMNEAIPTSLAEMAQFVAADCAFIVSYDFAAGSACTTHEWHAKGVRPKTDFLQNLSLSDCPDWVSLHLRGEPVLVADVSALPQGKLRRSVTTHGIKSMVALPMMGLKGCLGWVGFVSIQRPRHFGQEEVQLLTVFANVLVNVGQRQHVAHALQESDQRFRSLFEDIPNISVQGYDTQRRVVYWNRASEILYGYTSEEALGRPLEELIIPDKMRRCVVESVAAWVAGGPAIPASELVLKRKDGSSVSVYSSHAMMNGPTGLEMYCIDIDLTNLKQIEGQLRLTASVFEHAREAIMIAAPNGDIIDVNKGFTRLTGYSHDEVLGKNLILHRCNYQDDAFYEAMQKDLAANGHWVGEIWNRRKNGEVYAALETISAVYDSRGAVQQYVILLLDVTAQKKHESQLEYVVHYDALTRLPNRVLLADRLKQAMAQCHRQKQKLAVVYLDLDGFKKVNDRHGREVGDRLLSQISERMGQVLREADTLARLGGDEFAAVLLDIEDVDVCIPMLKRLLATASEEFTDNGITLGLSASLGVTFYPQKEELDADQLLRQADQAMYQAKLSGKHRYCFFDTEQDRKVRGHHDSLDRIRQGLADEEFLLYYQPKVHMRTGAIVGAEALIRWQHPERNLLPPGAFLPIIEAHPLAVEIGDWVLRTALTQAAAWRAVGLVLPISINVGALQLQQPSFVAKLRSLLLEFPTVQPGDLELEILETSALDDISHVSQVIRDCADLGVQFALDDFGTGYSSLTYLKRLPASTLKIDQSFVRDLLNNSEDLAILQGILGLATTFRRKVVAEGVETVAHGTMLLELGCNLAQGYGIARPMPAADMSTWVTSWRPPEAWFNRPIRRREDLPVLFAAVECRAWFAAVESQLAGEDKSRELERHTGQFEAWLEGEGKTNFGSIEAFRDIEMLHEKAHDSALGLARLKRSGASGRELIEEMQEFWRLRDALLMHLDELA